ncbi:MAG TPA: putative 2-aminoethylphosphonate ABC transporter substrate-binding protein, partial [Alphaproteobacteria bacterium]|nr:putative 2-aminoethylphosphonate ABC transporter substrate-binding protein [Alphaproteobacteria bacterium]
MGVKGLLAGLFACAGAIALLAGLSSEAAAQKTRLTVYTALENDQLAPYKQAFEA